MFLGVTGTTGGRGDVHSVSLVVFFFFFFFFSSLFSSLRFARMDYTENKRRNVERMKEKLQ